MPEDKRTDDLEKLPSEQKAIEERKQHLIDDLLRQREAANKEFDEKLAKLGYVHPLSGLDRWALNVPNAGNILKPQARVATQVSLSNSR